MHKLSIALVTFAALLAIGASGAQAANKHSGHTLIGLLKGLGFHTYVTQGEKRMPAVDLTGGDSDIVPEKSDGPDWTAEHASNPSGEVTDGGSASQDTEWTYETAQRPSSQWSSSAASP